MWYHATKECPLKETKSKDIECGNRILSLSLGIDIISINYLNVIENIVTIFVHALCVNDVSICVEEISTSSQNN